MERLDNNLQNVPLWQRLVWFGAIWAVSILALSLVAWVIKWAVKIPA